MAVKFFLRILGLTDRAGPADGGIPFITGAAQLLTAHMAIEPFVTLDEPVLTATGLAISLVLFTPDLVWVVRSAVAPVRKPKPPEASPTRPCSYERNGNQTRDHKPGRLFTLGSVF